MASKVSVVAAVLLSSASGSAQEMMKKKAEPAPVAAPTPAAAPAPAAHKPAPELDMLKWMEGNWKCKGKVYANPMMGPEHATASTVKGKRDLAKSEFEQAIAPA